MTLLDLETQVINGRNITITFRQVLNRYHIYLPPILAFYDKLSRLSIIESIAEMNLKMQKIKRDCPFDFLSMPAVLHGNG
jgi:hypothetical protein